MDLKGKGSNLFEEVVNNAKDFVEKQKGRWDHARWEAFLKDVQKKGVSMTDDLSNTLGSMLESLKKFYTTLPKGKVEEVMNNAKEFVEKQKGRWDHAKWEGFLNDLQKKGVSLTDDLSNALGSVLESLKKFYIILPASLRKGEEASVETTESQPSQETAQPDTTKQQEAAEAAVVHEQVTEETESKAVPEDTQPEVAKQESPKIKEPKAVPEDTQPEVAKQESPKIKEPKVVPEGKKAEQIKQETSEAAAAQKKQQAESKQVSEIAAEEKKVTEETSKPKKKSTARKSTRSRSKKSAEHEASEHEAEEAEEAEEQESQEEE